MNIPEFLPVLSHGSHRSPKQGACVMEMVSFLAGEEFSDQPECVALSIRGEAIAINDLVSDDNRNQIALLIPRFMGTNTLDDNLAFRGDLIKARRQFLEAREMKFIDSSNSSIAFSIKYSFEHDEGDKRRTNQEYDQIGIDWLHAVLDIADAHLGRHNLPSVEVYADRMKSHESQKANA